MIRRETNKEIRVSGTEGAIEGRDKQSDLSEEPPFWQIESSSRPFRAHTLLSYIVYSRRWREIRVNSSAT